MTLVPFSVPSYNSSRLLPYLCTILQVGTVAKVDIPDWRAHFDVVVACEEEDGDEDLDVPLVSIKFR